MSDVPRLRELRWIAEKIVAERQQICSQHPEAVGVRIADDFDTPCNELGDITPECENCYSLRYVGIGYLLWEEENRGKDQEYKVIDGLRVPIHLNILRVVQCQICDECYKRSKDNVARHWDPETALHISLTGRD